jgi:hypothetical protein
MADGTQLDPGSGGDVIATLDLAASPIAYPSGSPYKLCLSALYVGANATTAPTPVTTANPLPVAIQGTVAVSGTFWQATQPISAASLPLPTGASTAANQSTEITSLASIVSLLGSPLAVTQSGSWAVTANAGTNLNTSLLALESGGNLTKLANAVSSSVTPTKFQVSVTNTTLAVTQSGTWTVATNADTTIGGTVAPSKLLLIGGITADGTPAYDPIPLAAGGGSVVVSGTTSISGSVAATQSGTWTVGISASQTIAVTNAGTFAVQAAQSGTWNIGTVTAVTAITNALPAGTNVIGHVIADTGSTTAVTGNVTVVQATGTNLHAVLDAGTAVIGHVIVDSGTITTVSAVTAITNALPAGTNVIGHVIVDASTAVIGHVIVDSGTITTVSAVTAITNALPAGTNVIGHVIVDSGTVTANAGTNLNTSLLALETGGNLATLAGGVSASKYQVSLTQISGGACSSAGQTGTLQIGGAVATNTAVSNATYPLLIAGSDYGGTSKVQTWKVDGSGTGYISVTNSTLAVTQSGTWTVGISASQTIAVTNAGTFAVQAAQSGTWTVQPGNTANTTPWLANSSDPAATSGSISVADSATTTVTNQSGQSIITGTPTANSSVSVTLAGQTCLELQTSGTSSLTLAFERSMDGGTTYSAMSMEVVGVGTAISSLNETDNRATVLRTSCAGFTNFRTRCTARTSGTANITIQPSFAVANVPVGQVGSWTVAATQSGTWNVGTVTTVTTVSTVTAVTAITNALPAGTNTLGQVALVPVTSGGLTMYSLISGASTMAANVKNAAGQLYEIVCSNTGATVAYLKLFNSASAPTAGSGTPVWRLMIPGNTAGAGLAKTLPEGLAFSAGIGYTCTGGSADNDTTALAAGQVIVNLGYN